ncbi:MAG TPA: hypothetical protein VN643_21610 [Pyrinomonadaceae bacterium]|nr:hypothetical protein [Pyrinomonadaceae bacterium]
MSETLKITLTAVTGVTVFVIGQLIQKLFIEPIHEQRKSIGEVLYVLDYYRSLTFIEGIDWETQKEARKYLRRATSDLYRNTATIPAYRTLAFLRVVPKRRVIRSIQDEMSGLTKEVNNETLEAAHKKIKTELNMI